MALVHRKPRFHNTAETAYPGPDADYDGQICRDREGGRRRIGQDVQAGSKNKDIRSRLFEAVFSAYGLKAKFAEYPRYSESPRPIKGEYHFALAELFAAKWKENRSEMEKLCAEIGLDGYTAASLTG